ncbi:GNAT family N-acetyltransferase [Leptospira perolatii]|uniref:GNAT family N-acetyltransferase n=1 Tax=Leptospira perolatii TaxID=2023191 RepID=UPI001A9CA666|nr:GNAT family N-acetyltransferase [Leptospira perolatii]
MESTLIARGDGYYLSSEKSYLDRSTIHSFLSNSYWAKGIRKELVDVLIENSPACFGVYRGEPGSEGASQVAYARVVTDLVRFSYLADVFVLPEHRGNGLARWLVETIINLPKLRGTRFLLFTNDAHKVYSKVGFVPLRDSWKGMERLMNQDLISIDYNL